RRYRNDRCNGGGIGAGPPIADILEIPERPGLAGHEGHGLGGVQAGAATPGDDAVMLACAIDLHAVFDIPADRGGLDVGEQAGRPFNFSKAVTRAARLHCAGNSGVNMSARDVCIAVLVQVLWGAVLTLAKPLVGQISPILLMALAYTLAGLVLYPMAPRLKTR